MGMNDDERRNDDGVTTAPAGADAAEGLPEIEVRERGRTVEGRPVFADTRLFMQLLVFHQPHRSPVSGASSLGALLAEAGCSFVVYEDLNDPFGVGVLTWSRDPTSFVTTLRPLLSDAALGLVLRPEYTMLGRTYATGYETDLEFWLIDRPVRTVLDERLGWAIWYPLRRTGAFSKLPQREQGSILREHGLIGRAYAGKDLAHDVRLACHGLDSKDNEFVIGLLGRELHPLSHIVEAMRRTRQTSEFVSHMGPFFVGRVACRSNSAGR